MFLNVCKQTFQISQVRISQKVKGVLMWNLKHAIFIQRQRLRQIFKSALAYLKGLVSTKRSRILKRSRQPHKMVKHTQTIATCCWKVSLRVYELLLDTKRWRVNIAKNWFRITWTGCKILVSVKLALEISIYSTPIDWVSFELQFFIVRTFNVSFFKYKYP